MVYYYALFDILTKIYFRLYFTNEKKYQLHNWYIFLEGWIPHLIDCESILSNWQGSICKYFSRDFFFTDRLIRKYMCVSYQQV